MEAYYEIRDEFLIIGLPKELDHHSAMEIKKQSDKEFNKGNLKNIIFDFERTTFMDSSGIGVIMGRYKKVKDAGGFIGVMNINGAIHRIMEISGLYKIVENYGIISGVKKREWRGKDGHQ